LSRWIWGLLAKLPDRGELNSEEIGVVRELGKKAVLVGLGLKDDATTNEGLDELDPSVDDDDEDDEIPVEVTNDAEVALDDDVEVNAVEDQDPSQNGSGATRDDASTTAIAVPSDVSQETTKASSLVVEGAGKKHISELQSLEASAPDSAEDLAAAKERMVKDLNEPSIDDNKTIEDLQVPTEDLNWNTKATVDMILTVAGEMYGQRDLLEFRGIWDQ